MTYSSDTNNVKIFKITDNTLKIAKDYILHDELVAFPTETVYGLGANAFSDTAIRAIYEAKGRPIDNPLIVHVHKDYDISKLVYDEKPYVKRLRDAFLPGPLTIVYKSKGAVSPLVSCGLDTLALRVPSSSYAQRFLRYVDIPVAAPSANLSKHTSPVTAMHVYEDFKDKIPMILDGGRCERPLIMCSEEDSVFFNGFNVYSLGYSGEEMAERLYYGLHEGEKYDLLIGLKFEVKDEVSLSVENRFLKAFG